MTGYKGAFASFYAVRTEFSLTFLGILHDPALVASHSCILVRHSGQSTNEAAAVKLSIAFGPVVVNPHLPTVPSGLRDIRRWITTETGSPEGAHGTRTPFPRLPMG